MTPALPLVLSLALASPIMADTGQRGAPVAADARSLSGAHTRPPRPLSPAPAQRGGPTDALPQAEPTAGRASATARRPDRGPLRLALDGPAAPSVEVKKGDPAPDDGVWMPVARAISVADAYSRCDYERQRLRAELAAPPQTSIVPLIVAVVGGLVLGGVAGWSLHAAVVGR